MNAGLSVAVSMGVSIPSYGFLILGISNIVIIFLLCFSFCWLGGSRNKFLKKKNLLNETKEEKEVSSILVDNIVQTTDHRPN